ncbi:unnamed protein product [Gulo gulo]|uniref:Uncharacterized protein n=1 Tax=Gulo gulo TaxID=48420 RepID=A0A9X9LWN1_GULGU|nr:unnamed protein product [Gulo gulo]
MKGTESRAQLWISANRTTGAVRRWPGVPRRAQRCPAAV